MQRAIQKTKLISTIIIGAICLFSSHSFGQPYQGFQTNRYEPTSAGEWGFLVDHPWFSSTRYFAADVTLNYANKPLIFGDTKRWPFSPHDLDPAIDHQIIGHINLATSFLDRLQISLSWPVTFWEQGTEISGVSPITSPGYGDPRIGLMVRLLGQPYEDGISLSLGGLTYIPLRKWIDGLPEQLGDKEGRFIAKLVLSGVLRNDGSHHAAVWSIVSNFYFRPEAVIGSSIVDIDNSTSHQLQLGVSLGYGNLKDHFHLGVEAFLSTDILRGNAFQLGSMSLDLLLGTHIPLGRFFSLHLAGGIGLLHQSATPDARFIAQFAFAPWPKNKKQQEIHPAPVAVEAKPVQKPEPQTQPSVPVAKPEGSPSTGTNQTAVAPPVAPAQIPPPVVGTQAPVVITTPTSQPVQPIIVTPATPAAPAAPAPTIIVVPVPTPPPASTPTQPTPGSPAYINEQPKPTVIVKQKQKKKRRLKGNKRNRKNR